MADIRYEQLDKVLAAHKDPLAIEIARSINSRILATTDEVRGRLLTILPSGILRTAVGDEAIEDIKLMHSKLKETNTVKTLVPQELRETYHREFASRLQDSFAVAGPPPETYNVARSNLEIERAARQSIEKKQEQAVQERREDEQQKRKEEQKQRAKREEDDPVPWKARRIVTVPATMLGVGAGLTALEVAGGLGVSQIPVIGPPIGEAMSALSTVLQPAGTWVSSGINSIIPSLPSDLTALGAGAANLAGTYLAPALGAAAIGTGVFWGLGKWREGYLRWKHYEKHKDVPFKKHSFIENIGSGIYAAALPVTFPCYLAYHGLGKLGGLVAKTQKKLENAGKWIVQNNKTIAMGGIAGTTLGVLSLGWFPPAAGALIALGAAGVYIGQNAKSIKQEGEERQDAGRAPAPAPRAA